MLRQESKHFRTVFSLLLLTLVLACSEKVAWRTTPVSMETAATTLVVPIPCFPGTGPVVLRVNGVPIDESSIVRFEAMMRQRTPGMSAETVRRKTIEEVVVPMAALYAGHKQRIDEMSRRIRTASDRIARGDSFEAVALDTGDDLSARAGGVYGAVTRANAGLAQLPPVLEERVFSASVGIATEPFAGLVGFQIVRVDKSIGASDPKTEQREMRHILVHYDAAMAKNMRKVDLKHPQLKELIEQWQGEFTERSRRLIENARIEVVDPVWRPLIYPFRLAN